MSDYLPYSFDLSPSETWRERPVVLSITNDTPTGTASTTVTLDYDEMRRLAAHLSDYLTHFGPLSPDVHPRGSHFADDGTLCECDTST